jgi:glutamate--cysteine ligase
MTAASTKTEQSPRIEGMDQLVAWFRDACTPASAWRVGLEHEKFGLLRESGRAIGYGGPRGIERILQLFVERHGWQPVVDGDHVIELSRNTASITLEPGGQLELSGAPKSTVHEICAELQVHLRQAEAIGDELQIDWIGLGAHPTCTADEIELMPKPRYEIMNRYLPTRGKHAVDMMRRTCTIQASFDFSDEADCAEKLRLAMALSPVVAAMFANSPVSAGMHNGYLSERVSYWQDCDPDRCGLFPEVFQESWDFRRHVDRILDTPMFFIRRGGKLIDYTGRSFREFIAKGLDGHVATMADFELHLSTLFPEARLKKVIEVRGADAGGPKMLCALPSLWKGILYDAGARKDAWALVGAWSYEERVSVWRDVARRALDAEVRGTRLLDIAQDLLRISQASLRRQACLSRKGNDESFYLSEIERLLFEERRSPATKVLELWQGPWRGDVRKLVEYARY